MCTHMLQGSCQNNWSPNLSLLKITDFGFIKIAFKLFLRGLVGKTGNQFTIDVVQTCVFEFSRQASETSRKWANTKYKLVCKNLQCRLGRHRENADQKSSRDNYRYKNTTFILVTYLLSNPLSIHRTYLSEAHILTNW